MDELDTSTTIDALVARVLTVEDRTEGAPKAGYLLRYRGRLRLDSQIAYDQLANQLLPHALTPLFRWEEDGRHAILLVDKAPTPKETNPLLNLAFAIATILSVFYVGVQNNPPAVLPSDLMQAAWAYLQAGGPYTLALMAILGAHEFGHYLVGRAHGVRLTLPFFIPIPIPGSLGTMGAFINMKEQPRNRRHLLDIGLAGPLAGVVVAIVVLLIGLARSPLSPIVEAVPPYVNVMEGNSILYLALKFIVKGQLLPAPLSYDSAGALLYWLRYFFTGQPFPIGALDVQLDPVAWAGWAGLLVTSLNLIPAGQLDGGHALYVLIGRKRAAMIIPVILVALVVLGFFWNGWWLWAGLIFFFGRAHAQPLDEITPLDPPRVALAVLGVVLFFVVFMPVPLTMF
jgi:membrane-associated protease RseP (regulator of RpoE activity)